MDELPPPLPLGASGRLQAQPLVNAVGDHALLVRQGEQARALVTGEPAAADRERERVVVVPLDDDVELRVDGDALAIWLTRGSLTGGARVPAWASAVGTLLVIGMLGLTILGSVTAFTWLVDLIR